ncbi:MAG: TIGR04295 family B12-binding domain-containing radical SAM protein [Terriglobales bacterium]
MKYALVQPRWSFTGSTYFGCPETHLPLELFYARQQIEAAGHDTLLVDAHLEALEPDAAARRITSFAPDFVVLTTAPTYLFWRCPQPELRVPALWMQQLRQAAPKAVMVAIGPHGSATPAAVRAKLDCDVVVQGEAEQVLPQLAASGQIDGGYHQTDMARLAALDYRRYPMTLRQHRHHVFSGSGRGAEVEASRGCPWACTFCNKTLFRNQFRERPIPAVLAEVERLVKLGIDYIYFIDEIFGCGKSTQALLDGLRRLPVRFGMQTRIDLWNEDTLAALGAAGCVSLECGVESITPEGRKRFHKGCRIGTDRIQTLLLAAAQHIPWVQANLIAEEDDDLDAVNAWRASLIADGVWVSQPVPVFAFPGTPLYIRLFGPPDDRAWERAHQHYLATNHARGYYSDVQDQAPQPLEALEALERQTANARRLRGSSSRMS